MADCIDLVRYPIDCLDTGAGAALVTIVRGALAENGACELPGFLTATSVDLAVALAQAQRQQAFRITPQFRT